MKKYCVKLLRKKLLKKVFSNSLPKTFNLKSTKGLQLFGGFFTKSLWKGVWGRTFLQKGFPQ